MSGMSKRSVGRVKGAGVGLLGWALVTLIVGSPHSSRAEGPGEHAFLDRALEPPPSLGAGRPRPFSISPNVLYLNFDGATISKAADSDAHANTSFLCGGVVPAFDHTEHAGTRTEVIDRVSSAVDRLFADFDLEVVTIRPASPPYQMVVVGGDPSLCGQPPGYSGLAPLDCDNLVESDVAFVFSDGITSSEMLAVVIAHEAGHALGLPHSGESCDVMSNLLCPPQDKRFFDKEMQIPPDHLGKCGLTTTNSWRALHAVLGPGGVSTVARRPPARTTSPPPGLVRLDAGEPPQDPGGCQTAPLRAASGAAGWALLVLVLSAIRWHLRTIRAEQRHGHPGRTHFCDRRQELEQGAGQGLPQDPCPAAQHRRGAANRNTQG
jgi:hypothetical protein